MTLNALFVRTLVGASLLAGAGLLPATSALAQQGQGYVTLNAAQPSDTTGKTEVLEFFAYSCPHCAILEPKVEAWSKTLPADVALRPVPVAFNAGMGDLQKLYYTLEAMDRLDLHPKVFEAIHQQRERLFDAKAITEWVAKQGVDKAKFEQTFNSFGVQTKANKANELARNYQIDGTPSLAVGGKYVTSPALANGYDESIRKAQELLDRIKKG
ncbi:thiol:disulfide interchange protein DsbA/DsbL [Alcaligenes sp. SDU_A2]|uniref:thiol:disulfide interchange protein DsbA/DsbL n=1 Tax=Alcaligenes sp. SDU_A2 TaxID=3136634 RepID=UPI002C5A4DBC|nr:thiol:disulfide interchange protein DsbA/DsbL [Alcaligenes sp.]HRL26593.1 thiol:disulfide interchange protein DsbA/DsbL [Alcaligenes sp.]